ncbi:hypothetical protein [Streptomyces sp. NBC_00083]|uniref:hypothetical protein n=1 Tax=Streptomyces sp. NBC_00083 TaxID=2975647 RepID=UPI002252876B|nr:hypothetical protein [Streptomyces sp. NBC_00083]MCX5387885.1 hypothetical protein [Streptomyces sp. NBC_00083]
MSTAAFSESWQQVLDQAGVPAPGLALASAAPKGGGGGDLHHTPKPWNDAADAAHSLRIDSNTAKNSLTSAHAGIDTGTAGLLSVAALKSVLSSWEDRLAAARDECAALEPNLRSVAGTMSHTDHGVKSSIADYVNPEPADTKGR